MYSSFFHAELPRQQLCVQLETLNAISDWHWQTSTHFVLHCPLHIPFAPSQSDQVLKDVLDDTIHGLLRLIPLVLAIEITLWLSYANARSPQYVHQLDINAKQEPTMLYCYCSGARQYTMPR